MIVDEGMILKWILKKHDVGFGRYGLDLFGRVVKTGELL
jgi:hypothetical protein